MNGASHSDYGDQEWCGTETLPSHIQENRASPSLFSREAQHNMRLLNTRARKLEEFFGETIPKYAILSHTWVENEVTFKDIEQDGYKSGSVKIDGCLRSKETYVWIGTCCIDKSSSAELSEAINSMWSWYKKTVVCYVYLSDVPPGDVPARKDSAFRKSRWFTRG
jgi:hypothetical protein